MSTLGLTKYFLRCFDDKLIILIGNTADICVQPAVSHEADTDFIELFLKYLADEYGLGRVLVGTVPKTIRKHDYKIF